MPLPGDFGLVRIKGDTGWDIRFGQFLNGDGFSKAEHALFYGGKDSDGVDFVIEAEPGGVRTAPLSEYDGRSIFWSTDLIPLTDQERFYIIQKAMALIGTPYSFLDYLLIALYRLHVRPKFLVARVQGTGHVICSQLVAQIYDQVLPGGFTPFGKPSYLVTPGALYKYLESLRRKFAILARPKTKPIE